MMTQELKTKTYGAMVDGYWVTGFVVLKMILCKLATILMI